MNALSPNGDIERARGHGCMHLRAALSPVAAARNNIIVTS